ncbi:unnamed protein product [Arctogadus glacialis]
MSEEILEDRAKLKQGLIKVDDEDIRTLKREFGTVHRSLDAITQQSRDALQSIRKETLDGQYGKVEENLRHQFLLYMKFVEAPAGARKRRKDDFEGGYGNDLGDQNLHTLYEGVVGQRKLFSRPVLEVYLHCSAYDRATMEKLCTRLTYLFCIGLIALMGYAAVIGDDEESLGEEWAENMERVQQKMQEALGKCK